MVFSINWHGTGSETALKLRHSGTSYWCMENVQLFDLIFWRFNVFIIPGFLGVFLFCFAVFFFCQSLYNVIYLQSFKYIYTLDSCVHTGFFSIFNLVSVLLLLFWLYLLLFLILLFFFKSICLKFQALNRGFWKVKQQFTLVFFTETLRIQILSWGKLQQQLLMLYKQNDCVI